MKGQKLIRFHRPNIPNIDVSDILKSGQVTNGKYVRELEKLLCKMHHAKYAVCFSSATASMMMLFEDLHSADTILMPSFTWESPKKVIQMLGIYRTCIDIDKNTWTSTVRQQNDYRSKYIFLTATLGRIPKIAYPNKTIVDGATNAGYFDMKKHPCFALVVGFSPAKMVTGIEGGAVITNDKFLYRDLKYYQSFMFRMGEINAKIAIYNLKRIKKLRAEKMKLYKIYKKNLPFAKFQKIDKDHSLCEIAATFPFGEKQWKQVAKGMEVRKRYNPEGIGKNAVEIYKNVMSLPSYHDCDCNGVIRLLRKVYYG
jgi:dTDP-4-amino-4,6-dideoxygalactose transaminase